MLENFIQKNREAFDSAKPDERIWLNVERALGSADPLEKFILQNRQHFDEMPPPEKIWAKLEASGHLGDCALETFLTENRNSLDAVTPDLRVWANIEKALPGKREAKIVHVSWHQQLMRAAAAIALLLTVFGAGMWYAKNGTGENTMAMGEVSTEYRELEDFYRRDIAQKQEKLATFASQQQPILEDLAQLDKMMDELRLELADVPPGKREQVVRAMIVNYKAKSAILEKVLEHIQSSNSNQSKANQHEIQNI